MWLLRCELTAVVTGTVITTFAHIVMCFLYLSGQLMRSLLKVVVLNDRDFMEVIYPVKERGYVKGTSFRGSSITVFYASFAVQSSGSFRRVCT